MQGVPQDSLHPGPGEREEEDPEAGVYPGAQGGLQHDPPHHCEGRAQEGGQEGVSQHQGGRVRTLQLLRGTILPLRTELRGAETGLQVNISNCHTLALEM